MPHPIGRSSLLAALAAALASPPPARAQAVGAHATVLSPDHHLLDDTMAGGGVDLRFGRPGSWLGVRLSVDQLRSRGDRIGIPCAGLIRPGTCPPERVRDDGRLTAGTGGVVLRVLGGRRAALALTADAALASARVRSRGLVTGGRLDATKVLWGGLAGLDASWVPVAGQPFALEIGGALGGLTPVSREMVLDGYTPFEGGFDVARARVGVTWRPGGR